MKSGKEEINVAVYGLEEEAVSFITSLFKRDKIKVAQILGEKADPKDLAARLYKIGLGIEKGHVSVGDKKIYVRQEIHLGREVAIGKKDIQLQLPPGKEAVFVARDLEIEVLPISNIQEAAERLHPSVDAVIFTQKKMLKSRDLLGPFFESGIGQVVLTFPSSLADTTLISGVNDRLFSPSRHQIISAGDSISNCIIPVAKIIEEKFGKGAVVGALLVGTYSRDPFQPMGEKGVGPFQEGLLDNLILAPAVGAGSVFKNFFPGVGESLNIFSVKTPVEKGSILIMLFHMRGAEGINKKHLQKIFQCAAQSTRWEGKVRYDPEYDGSREYQRSTAGAEILGQLINVWPTLPGTDITPVVIPAACSGVCGFGWQIKRVIQSIRDRL